MTELISLCLAARPSFVEGFARLLDLGGTLNEYNSALTADQADEVAYTADIEALRQDMASAKQKLSYE